jgi:hypothetical protein
MEINSAWEMICKNISISAKEKHKPWLDEGCSELLHKRKQAKLQ